MGEPRTHIDWHTAEGALNGYSSKTICNALNLTLRQLNYLIGKGILPPGRGSGHHRRWTWNTFAKLTVAKRLFDALPPQLRREGPSAWTAIAEVAMDGPTPRAGYVVLDREGLVHYLGAARPTFATRGIVTKWDGVLRVDS